MRDKLLEKRSEYVEEYEALIKEAETVKIKIEVLDDILDDLDLDDEADEEAQPVEEAQEGVNPIIY